MSIGEETLSIHLKANRLEFEREYRFHPVRKWRFDFADPQRKIAVEVEGGIFTNGRHSRGSGMRSDMEKYNAATMLGWRVLRFFSDDVKSGKAINTIMQMIGSNANS